MSLFREEFVRRPAHRLHGDVSIAVPLRWRVIGYGLIAAVAASLVFLASASYSRSSMVTGAMVLDKGVASVIPMRPGVIESLSVREGQPVRAGAKLAEIRSEEGLASGGTAPGRMLAGLEEQDRRVSNQISLMERSAAADRARLLADADGLRQEIAGLGRQIAIQRRLRDIAEQDLKQAESVAARGFISRRDVQLRETTALARQQQLAQLEQTLGAKSAELRAAHRSIDQASRTAEAQAAGLQSTRAELSQRIAEVSGSQGYVLLSPVDGTVTALVARIGQTVAPDQPLMSIVPSGAHLRVELQVPSEAAGFLAVGQEVRLAVDAYPYATFGTIPARITQIATAAVPRPLADGRTVPTYLVTAEPSRSWIGAFGRRQPLLPGMTLSARIVTDRRSLLHWLFEPLFAVANR